MRDGKVKAGRRRLFRLDVGARETLRPGATPLLMEIELATRIGGEVQKDQVLANDTVELRIRGLSDVLKVLGVPTMFLLPGVLILGAFSLTGPDEGKRLAPNGLAFWILAVSFSLPLSLAYSAISSALGRARALTQGFNLADVAWIWTLSLILGGLGGIGMKRWANHQRKEAEKRSARDVADRTLTRSDDPLTMLEKLNRIGVTWPLQWFRIGGRGGFLVEAGGSRWLVPQAQAPAERPSGIDAGAWRSARSALGKLVSDEPSLADLITELRADGLKALGPLQWRSGHPEPLDEHDKPEPGDAHRFIETG
jgi:hypothetical protein